MAIRDGCPAHPEDPRNQRYFLGERLYLEQAPQLQASVVIDNTDVAHPLVRAGS